MKNNTIIQLQDLSKELKKDYKNSDINNLLQEINHHYSLIEEKYKKEAQDEPLFEGEKKATNVLNMEGEEVKHSDEKDTEKTVNKEENREEPRKAVNKITFLNNTKKIKSILKGKIKKQSVQKEEVKEAVRSEIKGEVKTPFNKKRLGIGCLSTVGLGVVLVTVYLSFFTSSTPPENNVAPVNVIELEADPKDEEKNSNLEIKDEIGNENGSGLKGEVAVNDENGAFGTEATVNEELSGGESKSSSSVNDFLPQDEVLGQLKELREAQITLANNLNNINEQLSGDNLSNAVGELFSQFINELTEKQINPLIEENKILRNEIENLHEVIKGLEEIKNTNKGGQLSGDNDLNRLFELSNCGVNK